MPPQTAIGAPKKFLRGQHIIAGPGTPYIIEGFRLESAAAVGFGEFMVTGNNAFRCRRPADVAYDFATATGIHNGLGFVVRDRTMPANKNDQFTQGMMVPILRMGWIVVRANEAITKYKRLRVTAGNGTQFLDTGGEIIPGARWVDDVASGENGIVEVLQALVPTVA